MCNEKKPETSKRSEKGKKMSAGNSPEVSVVITMYREKSLLSETVDSILNQTFQDFEIVLVDNNADPETIEVADRYVTQFPDKIRMVKEPVQGVSAAKNRGINESRGTFIALHDGDDLSHPDRLAIQWLIMKNKPELALVCSWFDRVDSDGVTVIKKDINESTPEFWYMNEKIIKKFFPERLGSDPQSPLNFSLISTTFFRKKTAIACGLFDNRFNPRWFEDFEFLLKMYEQGEFYKIPISLLRYRMHTAERAAILQKQMNWTALIKHMDLFYQILWERFGNRSRDSKDIFNELRAYWLRYIAPFFLQYQNGAELGRKVLSRSLKHNPSDLVTWKLWGKTFLPHKSYPQYFWFDSLKEESLPEGANLQLIHSVFRQIDVRKS